jgi:hypothetical protein
MMRNILIEVLVSSITLPNRTVMAQRSTMPYLVVYQEENPCLMEEFLGYVLSNRL